MTEKIKVVIADDQEIFRDGLQLVLSKAENIDVVGEAANGQELVNIVAKAKPDVVLTDVVMPVMDGVHATKQIKAMHPDTCVIGLSMFGEEAMIMDMIDAGALSYLIKNADKEEIYTAVTYGYSHKPYYCKATTSQLAKFIIRNKQKTNEQATLFSEKELQIIKCICDEMSNYEMSKTLYMSKRTIDGYRSRILEKLNVKNSIAVVKYAIKTGIYKL